MSQNMPPIIFSATRREAVRQRAGFLSDRNAADNFIMQDMVDDVADRLSFMRFEPTNALVVVDNPDTVVDLLTGDGGQITAIAPDEIDQERPYPTSGFDFIASFGTLDTLNDLPGALIHLRHALAPSGIVMASFLGAGTLTTLREILLEADQDRPAARIHPMVDNRAAAELMQRAGFARQVVDSRTLSVSYSSLQKLVNDLRMFGLTNRLASPPPPFGKAGWERARQAFFKRADNTGRIMERFEILTLTGWAR